jgi:hypothetical protein
MREASGRSVRVERLCALLLVSLAALATSVASARGSAASSSASIEGVWSFNGGTVAIQSQPGGTFIGTVVAPTKFAQCPHPVGEAMWTGMRLQADGSYWGSHQWYFETSECVRNPTLGPTAWRVMQASSGTHYLLVCFSAPGSAQPTIAVSGVHANVSYGCFESARIAPLPSTSGTSGFTRSVTLPSARRCYSRRAFQIHLRDPRYDPLKEVVVTIRGHKVAVVRRKKVFAATINLTGLPPGSFTVKIRATTILGHHLTGSRTYHTCAKKRLKAAAHARRHHR